MKIFIDKIQYKKNKIITTYKAIYRGISRNGHLMYYAFECDNESKKLGFKTFNQNRIVRLERLAKFHVK